MAVIVLHCWALTAGSRENPGIFPNAPLDDDPRACRKSLYANVGGLCIRTGVSEVSIGQSERHGSRKLPTDGILSYDRPTIYFSRFYALKFPKVEQKNSLEVGVGSLAGMRMFHGDKRWSVSSFFSDYTEIDNLSDRILAKKEYSCRPISMAARVCNLRRGKVSVQSRISPNMLPFHPK